VPLPIEAHRKVERWREKERLFPVSSSLMKKIYEENSKGGGSICRKKNGN